MNSAEICECSEREKKIFVPIFRSEKKVTLWMLNNASRFVYDEVIGEYEEKPCTKKYRNSRSEFDKLILEKLEGSKDVLSLYYFDECDKDKRTCRLLFNACNVYEEICDCEPVPDSKYKRFCRLFDFELNEIGDLIEIGYILCDLIPRVEVYQNEQGYSAGLKVRLKLQREENLVWDMLNNYANKHIFRGLQIKSYDLISLIGKNNALREFFEYKADDNTALRIEGLYLYIRDRLEMCLDEFEKEWNIFKLENDYK